MPVDEGVIGRFEVARVQPVQKTDDSPDDHDDEKNDERDRPFGRTIGRVAI